MELDRRTVLAVAAGIGAGVGAGIAAQPAQACSITARRLPRSFSDKDCRQSLAQFVEALNRAPSLSEAELIELALNLSITFDSEIERMILAERTGGEPAEQAAVLNGWTLTLGQRDAAPIKLIQTQRLSAKKGKAVYAFTLRRAISYPAFNAEESDSCGAMAYAVVQSLTETTYLGVFRDNSLDKVILYDIRSAGFIGHAAPDPSETD